VVLEQLFSDSWLEKKLSMSFILGLSFTFIGVVLARLLFGGNSGIVAVFFISLFVIPGMRKLIKKEDRAEISESSFSLLRLWKDNKQLVLTYLGIFIGVYVATYLITYFSYQFGLDASTIFREQLFLEPAISGRATFFSGLFWDILLNNWWVLLATFFLGIITGDGATFFVVWNASAWAAIFAYRSFAAGSILSTSFVEVAILLQLIVLPHLLIEGLAYILAGIAGSIISQDVVQESNELQVFLIYFFFGIVAFIIGNYFFSTLFSQQGLLFLSRMALALIIVWFFHRAFTNVRHQSVFRYNYWLFVIAILVFLLGVGVETLVLSSSGLLETYYTAAARF
jgi:hypothetical protein